MQETGDDAIVKWLVKNRPLQDERICGVIAVHCCASHCPFIVLEIKSTQTGIFAYNLSRNTANN